MADPNPPLYPWTLPIVSSTKWCEHDGELQATYAFVMEDRTNYSCDIHQAAVRAFMVRRVAIVRGESTEDEGSP
jgi:hypothetical protein